MPSTLHDAPAELLRLNPLLAAALVLDQGLDPRAEQIAADCLWNDPGTSVSLLDSNFSVIDPLDRSASPVELHPDGAVLLESRSGRLVVVFESQMAPPKPGKRRAWTAYITVGHTRFKCDAVLVVTTYDRRTEKSCRHPWRTGHPKFDLEVIVRGPENCPDPGNPILARAAPELMMLCTLTHVYNLNDPQIRETVLEVIADLDDERRGIYTHILRTVASASARKALEDLMAFEYKDDFIDKFRNEGVTEGMTQGMSEVLLSILAARGFSLSGRTRERVLSCNDPTRLKAWSVAAATAHSLQEVFGSTESLIRV